MVVMLQARNLSVVYRARKAIYAENESRRRVEIGDGFLERRA